MVARADGLSAFLFFRFSCGSGDGMSLGVEVLTHSK